MVYKELVYSSFHWVEIYYDVVVGQMELAWTWAGDDWMLVIHRTIVYWTKVVSLIGNSK